MKKCKFVLNFVRALYWPDKKYIGMQIIENINTSLKIVLKSNIENWFNNKFEKITTINIENKSKNNNNNLLMNEGKLVIFKRVLFK